ncbi:MAG: 5-formyltetrahydrofolate cyclo-ligase [Promethearchaeota archaeon]
MATTDPRVPVPAIQSQKAAVRTRLLELRRTREFDRIAAASAIFSRLLALPEFAAKGPAYFHVGKEASGEVPTGFMIVELLRRGVVVCLPKTLVAEGTLAFARVRRFPQDLARGAFGVLEPLPWCFSRPAPTPSCVVVPGVAFDEFGNRLGYGKGYYDAFLSGLAALKPRPSFVGLAWEFQVIPRLPTTPHDVPVDVVVTEARVARRGDEKLVRGKATNE